METNIAITVKNLSKTFRIPQKKVDAFRTVFVNLFDKRIYKEYKALDNISFDVKKGEFLGIIGRNGSGKSTLLKILAGVYTGDCGEVYINGRISPFLELGLGFNPQLTGRDNIYLNSTILGLCKEDIEDKFDSIVGFAEIEKFIDQQIKNYSSGMKARLAFSVAIHSNRDILLLDEVLAVGDISFSKKCHEIFRYFKNNGRTIILVTHGMDIVKKFCDRVVILDQSKIINSGDPKKMVAQYSHLFQPRKV